MGMIPYYAELSFGGMTLHLSGSADDGIPDGLGIAKEGIEGLLSSPALKVTATERSYGNGGHDVAEDDVQYAARTLTVHFLAMGNDRTDAMAHLNALATSTGRIVRLRVVDAQRDVYCVGYCQRDVEATWSDGRFTGTLTIVCQRPELLSTRASQSQLFPVSRVSGGLSYGIPAFDTAWLGAANASMSTLSQDGKVVATNLVANPKLLTYGVVVGQAGAATVPNLSDTDNGLKVESTTPDPNNADSFAALSLNVTPGRKYHLSTILEREDYGVWNNGPLFVVEWNPDGGVAATHMMIGGDGAGLKTFDFTTTQNSSHIDIRLYAPVKRGDCTVWSHMLLCTDTDWQAMQALGIDWFDGDGQSPQPNSGLSYGPDGKGLSYGVSASEERNLVVVGNRGTTVSYPSITVTGPFPNGVEIQTGVGGVIRYAGAVGMVPLVMQCDPRSMAASMGGVDVGRYLTGRDLPAIPAGGSVSLRLMSAGSGWVTVTMRDTYL